MTEPVRKLYNAALRDRQFNEETKKADPVGYKKPNLWSDSLLKHIYATTYFGWWVKDNSTGKIFIKPRIY